MQKGSTQASLCYVMHGECNTLCGAIVLFGCERTIVPVFKTAERVISNSGE
jgi:hypothetical protein